MKFPSAIPIEYIGSPRRWFQTGVPTDATNPAMHPSTLVVARYELFPIAIITPTPTQS
ncbi:hypothetical protein NZK35_16910 [Stieleria sp. ICT_E10.1]|nr:hypothetical protein [Stieleria sedimenti]